MSLAALLLWAAVSKIVERQTPRASTTIFDEITRQSKVIRYSVVGMEVCVAAWLIAGRLLPIASLMLLVMLTAFTGLIAAELSKGDPRACGCFGANRAAQDPAAIRRGLVVSLVRNGFLLTATGWLFFVSAKEVGADMGQRRGATGTRGEYSASVLFAQQGYMLEEAETVLRQ
jgi:hypothetical protein